MRVPHLPDNLRPSDTSRAIHRLLCATAASLVIHASLALVLCDQWLEVHVERLPPPITVERDAGPREIVLPESVRDAWRPIVRREAVEVPVATGSPGAAVGQFARRPAAMSELLAAIEAVHGGTSRSVPEPPILSHRRAGAPRNADLPKQADVRRRAAAYASLPPAAVALPATADTPQIEPQDAFVSAPANVSWERSTRPSADDNRSFLESLLAPGETPSLPQLHERRMHAASARDSNGMLVRPVRTLPPARGPTGVDEAPSQTGSSGELRRPAAAYAHRRRVVDSSRPVGGAPSNVDAAVERGLDFLARVQTDDGRWRFDYLAGMVDPDVEEVSIRADAAATGLALLAYLGAGHDHLDGRYRRVVEQALAYLVRVQRESGELFPEDSERTGHVTRFYSHGIATLALCEAYGMTGEAKLYQPAQRAIDFLASTQQPQMGGWRYVPGVNTDLSVTGWQLMALRSGQLAGLTVQPETLTRIRACLESCRDEDGQRALFRYNPWASPDDPKTRHGRLPSTVMTSVGLLMQLHLEGDVGDERLRGGAAHLLANLPQIGESPGAAPIGTLGNPQRDTYYWYYATQVMHYLGGDEWRAWSERLHPLLLDSQIESGPLAGSWDPLRPVPDQWATFGGRLYVTALNLLSLEIANRRLPLEEPAPPRMADRP